MNVGNKVLGLAVGQKSILVAEVTNRAGRIAVTQVGEFTFPADVLMSAPDRMGRALHAFLKVNRFSARNAVIGLPAKRLLTRRKDVPPASPMVAATTIRLQAETEFSSELDNLVMDFAGQTDAKTPSTVLVVATNRIEVEELEVMARTAGLKVHAVTSTTAALGRATPRLPGGDGLVLNLGPGGAELVVQHGTDPAHLRHLNVVGGSESLPALAGEIRRTMASIPRNGTPQTLALWNATEVENPGSILEQRLAMPVTMPELGSLVATDTADAERFAPAVAVALSAMEASGPPVDFLHSRLAPPKPPVVSRAKMVAIAAGVVIAAFAAYAYIDLGSLQDDLNLRNGKLKNQANDVDRANFEIKRLDTATKWLPTGPRFIAVLGDLTQLFPDGPNTIWATSLASKEKDVWEMQGLSPTQQYIQNLVDQMHAVPRFKDLKAGLAEEKSGTSKLYRFRIEFRYDPAGIPEATGAASRNARTNTNTRARTAVVQTAPASAAATAPEAGPAATLPVVR